MGDGKLVGTPGYIAPEVIERQPYGTASDIWSLGCLLFLMLTATMYPDPHTSYSSENFISLEAASPACTELLTALLNVDPTARPSIDNVLKHTFFS